MKKLITLITALVISTGVNAQTLKSVIGNMVTNESVTVENARRALISEDFGKALYLYQTIIASQQANRSQGSQVNNEIMAEYAYTLALTGAQQPALINIDLALNLIQPSATVYYYVGCILDVIGFEAIAQPYIKIGKSPKWMLGRDEQLNDKYRSPVLLSIERTDRALEHITTCLTEERNIEAICYATRLTQLDPDSQAAWLLQSAAFEKIGCYTFALDSFKKGMSIGDNTDKPGVESQWEYLTKKSQKKGNSVNVWQPGFMVYGGLSCSNKTTYITGRYGIYSGPLSLSANMSLGIPMHGKCSYYAGVSCFYNIGKLFTGLGFGLDCIGASATCTFSPTVGLSFINAKRTSSFDISVAWSIPCQSGMKSSLDISIGKTFYFNSNGKSK